MEIIQKGNDTKKEMIQSEDSEYWRCREMEVISKGDKNK